MFCSFQGEDWNHQISFFCLVEVCDGQAGAIHADTVAEGSGIVSGEIGDDLASAISDEAPQSPRKP